MGKPISQAIMDGYNEQQKPHYGYMMYTDGKSIDNGIKVDDGVIITQGGTDVISTTNNGTQLQKNISNTGAVKRDKNSFMQEENITKWMMIPSSLVTPLPDKLPWLDILFGLGAIQQLAIELIKTVTD